MMFQLLKLRRKSIGSAIHTFYGKNIKETTKSSRTTKFQRASSVSHPVNALSTPEISIKALEFIAKLKIAVGTKQAIYMLENWEDLGGDI